MELVVALFLYFLMLAFLAVGGAPSVLPDMHRYVVEVHGWMTSAQFAELYTLAQVAPGPNVMYIPLIGWQIAGWAGAAATTLSMLAPSGTLTLLVAHLQARHPKATLGIAIRRGLTPITIGLISQAVGYCCRLSTTTGAATRSPPRPSRWSCEPR